MGDNVMRMWDQLENVKEKYQLADTNVDFTVKFE
jgi:hypothetical protein